MENKELLQKCFDYLIEQNNELKEKIRLLEFENERLKMIDKSRDIHPVDPYIPPYQPFWWENGPTCNTLVEV